MGDFLSDLGSVFGIGGSGGDRGKGGALGPSKLLSNLPILGGLGTSMGLWSNPDQDAVQQAIKEMQAQYANYRPQAAQARMNGLDNQLSAFNGPNAMLKQLYGPNAGVDMAKLMRNPMPPGMDGSAPPKPPPPALGLYGSLTPTNQTPGQILGTRPTGSGDRK